MTMQANVGRRVLHTKLPSSKSLMPVLECIVNSIHATNNLVPGVARIDVEILRDDRQNTLLEERSEPPIIGFVIRDNGVGFNTENYDSFSVADSDYKKNLGAKGVGRFLWLKAFSEVFVTSFFIEEGRRFKRSFIFKASKEGIHEHALEAVEMGDGSTGTELHLKDFGEVFQRNCPKRTSTIAAKIVTHLLIYFHHGKIPSTTIFDSFEPGGILLNALYKEQIASTIDTSVFLLNSHKFEVSFMKQKDVASNIHEVMLCADEREVVTDSLTKYLSGLPARLQDDGDASEPYVLWIYVTGQYLDANANPERTEFSFAPDDQATLDDLVSKSDLTVAVTRSVKDKYASLFNKIEFEHATRLQSIVAEKLPHYRPLLTAQFKHIVEKIPVGASDDEIEVSFHKGLRDAEIELKQRAKEITSATPSSLAEMEELRQKYEKFVDQENVIGMATLAKYVVHRKVILDLFEKAIQLSVDGGFVLEKVLHGLICPLRADSSDMDWLERQNLWLIDERLTHHLHLQSDKSLRSNPVVSIQSSKEPDLLVFENGPHAFSDVARHPGSAVIIEFKRPGSDRQTSDPLDQITGYIDKINSGKLRDRKGELVRLPEIPYTGYVICDLTEDVMASARRYGLKQSPDQKSFYGYLGNWNCYCEILSFQTVLEDAKKRNKVLFEKLNLPLS